MGRPLRLDGGEAWSSIHDEDGDVFRRKEINMKGNSPISLLDLRGFPPERKTAYGLDEDVYFSMKREIEKG